MTKPLFKISELKIGDMIQIYINRGESGASMGPSIEGNIEYLRWVAFGGHIYTNDIGEGYYMDTKTPIGIPLHDGYIFGVQKNSAIDVIEQIARVDALSHGRWHLKNYKTLFNKLPFPIGTRIRCN